MNGGSPAAAADGPVRFTLFALIVLLACMPPGTRGESMVGCGLLVLLAATMSWSSPARQLSGRVTIVAGMAGAVLAARSALAPGAAVQPSAMVVLAAAALLATATLDDNDAVRRQLCVVLALAAGAVSLHAIQQRLWGLDRLLRTVATDPSLPDREIVITKLEGGRAFAGFVTPAGLGGFLALALPVTVSLAIGQKGRLRLLWVALVVLEAAALLAAASATAAAALIAAVLLAGLVWGRAGRKLALALVVGAVVLGGIALQRDGIVLRPDDPTGPWRLRAGNYRAAWQMAADHPWKGVGPGGFSELYPAYRQPGDNETRHVHNVVLELAAELGWPAALLVAALLLHLFCSPLWNERESRVPWRRGLAVGLASFAVHNLADFTVFMPSLLILAALLRGALIPAAPRTDRETGTRRALAGVSLACVLIAAVIAALGGWSGNLRMEARYAAHAGELDEALSLSERAARLAPWSADATLLLVRASAASELDARLILARADLAVRASPVRPAARVERARARLHVGDVEGALADLTRATELYPMNEVYENQRMALLARIAAATSGAGG